MEESIKEQYAQPDISRKEEYLKDAVIKEWIGGICKEGMKALERQVKEILNSPERKERKTGQVSKLFDAVYYFTSLGVLFNSQRKSEMLPRPFVIKLYRISQKYI